MRIKPILLVLSTSESVPRNSSDISSNLLDNFPILAQINPLATHPATDPSSMDSPPASGSSTDPPLPMATPYALPPTAPPHHTLSAMIISLPGLFLESARSHVLEEPVPRRSSSSTLPWDCSLSDLAVLTILGGGAARYVLEPVAVKMTFASQQEGVGVAIHSEVVSFSLSKKQVKRNVLCF